MGNAGSAQEELSHSFLFLFSKNMTKNSERLKLQQIIIVLTMLVVIIGVPLILLAVALKLIYYVLFVL